jgi:hypothetical protein
MRIRFLNRRTQGAPGVGSTDVIARIQVGGIAEVVDRVGGSGRGDGQEKE